MSETTTKVDATPAATPRRDLWITTQGNRRVRADLVDEVRDVRWGLLTRIVARADQSEVRIEIAKKSLVVTFFATEWAANEAADGLLSAIARHRDASGVLSHNGSGWIFERFATDASS